MTLTLPEQESLAGRRVAVTLALAVLLLGSFALYSLNSTAINISPVLISADENSKTVLDGQRVYFAISLDNTDTQYAKQTIQMQAHFLTGAPWDSGFTADISGNPLPDVFDADDRGRPTTDLVPNGTEVVKDTTKTIYFYVDAPANGHLLDPRQIQVVGYDNYGHLTGGSNVTKKSDGTSLILTVTAVKEYDVTITIDPTSQAGNINLYQDEDTRWGFTIENTGFRQDTYTLVGKAYKVGSPTPEPWSITFPGGNTKQISGTETVGGTHKIETTMTITPGLTATSGAYEIEIRATGTNTSKADRADAQIPLPDFVIETGDVTLSHSAACVPCKVDDEQQAVTIYAKVRNDGGNRDNAGRATRNVDVTFTVLNADDLSPAGNVNTTGSNSDTFYVPSLNHGEERTVKLKFTPNPIDDAEATLLIQVTIDEFNSGGSDVDIGESNSINNAVSETLKVVKPGTTGTSFNVGFVALLGAALVVAGLASRYRRDREDEEE